MKIKLLLIFCAFCSITAFAQVPTPVIGLDFENDETVDVIGSLGIEVVAHNATYEVDAERGNVIVFDGNGNGSTTPSSFAGTWVDLTPEVFNFGEVTFNVWFYCNGSVELWSRLLTLADTTVGTAASPTAFIAVNNNRGTVVGPEGAQQNQLSYSVGLNDAEAVAGREVGAGTIEPDTWYMLTVTHSADKIQMYLDGVFMAEVELPAPLLPIDLYEANTNHCGLGTSQWGDPLFFGKMDNFTVYNKILTEAEIEALYNCTENCVKPASGINDIISLQPVIYSSEGLIYIKNVNNSDINAVQIYNMVGSLIYQTNKFSEAIQTDLSSGMYFVKINSNQGDFVKKVNIE
jgi:hypothetical protein